MAVVGVPSLLRELTGGASRVEVPAGTVEELVEVLEDRYPGVKARLLEDGRVRPNISVVVDGVVSEKRLRHRLEEGSEVHFLPVISGGDT